MTTQCTLAVCAALALLGACGSNATASKLTGDGGSPREADASVSDASKGDGKDAAGQADCSVAHEWQFGRGGGFINSQTVAELKMPATLIVTRTLNGPNPTSKMCTPPLPACDTADKVDLSDISQDLADPDVMAALAETEPPFFGGLAVDSGVFHVGRDDGRGFDVAGGDCLPSDAGTCRVTPPGISKFIEDLQALEDQGLADPACADLTH